MLGINKSAGTLLELARQGLAMLFSRTPFVAFYFPIFLFLFWA
jgi:hypothetical protein